MGRMSALQAALLVVAVLALAACGTESKGGTPGGGEQVAAAQQAVGQQQQLVADGQVCVTVQRGASGNVADATISQNAPSLNDGAGTHLYTGTLPSAGRRRALVRYDLSGIPAGVTVVSASASVYQLRDGTPSTISAYRVTAPWIESAVTWAGFNAGFDPAPVGSFVVSGNGSAAFRSINVLSLAQGWASGTIPNHGILLDEPASGNNSTTSYRSSETGTVAQRPKLALCYVTCADGLQNGAETGVDCGGPACPACCQPSPEVCDGNDNDCDGAVDEDLCSASDACHVVGVCNPATGQCTNPAAPDGTACNDGNACTQSDSCQAGACIAGNSVACAPVDACHAPGTCDPATGVCAAGPAVPDGTACNDGDACTQGDTCQTGACAAGTPLSCAAADGCHGVGACDPATGACLIGPALTDGTACNDGDAGTEFDTCQAGACVGANSVVVIIQSPVNGAVAGADTIQVTGTVDQPVSSVRIGEVQAAVNALSFSATVPLHEGSNILAIEATGATGNPGSAAVVVARDTKPPRVAITLPADRALIPGNTATVTGSVQDMVLGAVGTGDCAVTVNGVPAEVEHGSFRAENVPVAEGPGTITVVANDVAGNTGSAVIEVQGSLASNAMIVGAGGDGQTAVVGTPLAQPLTVQLLDNTGQPVPDMEVTFQVTRSNGFLGNGARSETVLSNGQGFASVTLTLGASAGAASDQVTATAQSFLGAATFAASGVPDPMGERVLTVASGGNQKGASGSLAPLPLGVFLSDGQGNPVPYQEVTFTVKQGGGRVDGASTIVKASDFDGRTFVLLTMGSAIGDGTQIVQATAEGANAVTFVGSTRAVADPANTTITGLVLTNENDPIQNALVEVEGMGVQGTTDAEGHFELTVPLPANIIGYKRVHLDVRGATGGPFPSELEFEMDLIPGAENTMERPAYLPAVDTGGVATANEAADIAIRRQDVPGFVFEVPARSATFIQEGICASDAECTGGGTCMAAHCTSKTGQIQVITVHNDKIPMLPSDGAIPTLAFAIMPHTARFDPPAPIRIPNVDGREPGEVVHLYSYDHDLGTFVIVGTATVSEDGQEIRSERGQGIVKGGWHYVPPRVVAPVPVTGYPCMVDVCTTCGNPLCPSGDTGASSLACWTCQLNGDGDPDLCIGNGGAVCDIFIEDPDTGDIVVDPCYATLPPTEQPTGPPTTYSPDYRCYELNVSSAICPSSRGPVSCTRGYDHDHPLLTGKSGSCVVPTFSNTGNDPTCCPTGYFCTADTESVCCDTPCNAGYCN